MDTLFYLAITILVLALVVLGARAIGVYGQRASYAAYWSTRNKQQASPHAIRLLVLGDSIMQGIGASTPDKGLAGLIAERIEQRTKRPVAVTNYSVTGARVHDLLEKQLPLADFAKADIVAVCVSSNDSFRRTPIGDFRKDIETLMAALPPRITVVADVPGVGPRGLYQPALQAAAEKHGLRRAELATAFSGVDSNFGITAGDFFHPNDRGYGIWFSAFRPQIDELVEQLKTETI